MQSELFFNRSRQDVGGAVVGFQGWRVGSATSSEAVATRWEAQLDFRGIDICCESDGVAGLKKKYGGQAGLAKL